MAAVNISEVCQDSNSEKAHENFTFLHFSFSNAFDRVAVSLPLMFQTFIDVMVFKHLVNIKLLVGYLLQKHFITALKCWPER